MAMVSALSIRGLLFERFKASNSRTHCSEAKAKLAVNVNNAATFMSNTWMLVDLTLGETESSLQKESHAEGTFIFASRWRHLWGFERSAEGKSVYSWLKCPSGS